MSVIGIFHQLWLIGCTIHRRLMDLWSIVIMQTEQRQKLRLTTYVKWAVLHDGKSTHPKFQ